MIVTSIFAFLAIIYVSFHFGYSSGMLSGYSKAEHLMFSRYSNMKYSLNLKLDEIEYEITHGKHVGDKVYASTEIQKWVATQKEENAKLFDGYKARINHE